MKQIIWAIVFATGISTSSESLTAVVFVDGKNWRQLTETTGLSFDAVANHCPIGGGPCGGIFDGWTWATVTEVQSMYQTYNPAFVINGGTSDFDPGTNDNEWATEFLADFNNTGGAPGFFPFVSGWTAEELDSTFAYFGEVADSFLIDFGDRMRTARSPRSAGSPLRGVWLYETVGFSDGDADGVADGIDNCLLVANPAQQDTNGDSIGNACDPDLAPVDNDCIVNFLDLTAMQAAFFSQAGSAGWNPDADFTADDRVNFSDLTVMQEAFFAAPGPSAAGCN